MLPAQHPAGGSRNCVDRGIAHPGVTLADRLEGNEPLRLVHSSTPTSDPPRVRVLLGCDFFLKYTAALTAGLAREGADVALLSRDHDFEYGGVPGAMCRGVRATLPEGVPHLMLAGRVRHLAQIPQLLHARARARRFAPEVVHLQDSVANDPRLFFASGARLGRFALTVHDPTPHPGDAPQSAWKRLTRRFLIRTAGLIFVHAETLAAETRQVYSPRAPVVVVPHGLQPAVWTEPPAEPTLLFFGRVSHYKGLDVLLDAMPLIWESRPDVRLTVAGRGDYPDHRILDDRRVTVTRDYVVDAEANAMFERASAVVLPYRQASQSGVGSQGRRHGRALIVTDVGGLPELVTPETGSVVAPEDPVGLASAALEMLSDPERVGAMGRAAAELARNGADWDSVARLTLEAYRRHLKA
jgi:alpha-maltose-1-phosphate synthase